MKGKKRESIYINGVYLEEILSESTWSKAKLSEELGYSKVYLNNCLSRERMDLTAARYACLLLNGNYEKLTKRPTPRDTAPKQKPGEATASNKDVVMESTELVVSYIQDIGKIMQDIMRLIRDLRAEQNESNAKLYTTLHDMDVFLRNANAESRSYHTNVNNSLAEAKNILKQAKK